MMRRRLLVMIAVCATAVLGTATASSAVGAPSADRTCAGGPIAPGTYRSLTVTGFCAIQGHVDIRGGLTIAAGGGLDAAGQNCDVFLNVSGGVRVQTNGVLFLGNSEGTTDQQGNPCPNSNDVVRGGLRGSGALGVVVHGTTIDGGFSLQGGGGGNSYFDFGPPEGVFCANAPGLPFPPFSDIEDSRVNGGASISGLSTCWMGFIRNHVNGGVSVTNNTLGDPDAIEIGLNVIHGGLACSGNQRDPASPILPLGVGGVPTNSFDGPPANPNTVTGPKTGQCAGL